MVISTLKGCELLPKRDIFQEKRLFYVLLQISCSKVLLVNERVPLFMSCFLLEPRLERRDLNHTCARSNLGVRSCGKTSCT